jgi:hypothetical protein
MHNIKVLKLVNNPWTNIPKFLVEDPFYKDPAWILKIKNLVNIPTPLEIKPPKDTHIPYSPSISSFTSSAPPRFTECDKMMEFYFLQNDDSSDVSSRQSANSIAYASASLYKSLTTLSSCLPEQTQLWKSLDGHIHGLSHHFILRIEQECFYAN